MSLKFISKQFNLELPYGARICNPHRKITDQLINNELFGLENKDDDNEANDPTYKVNEPDFNDTARDNIDVLNDILLNTSSSEIVVSPVKFTVYSPVELLSKVWNFLLKIWLLRL